MIITVKKINGGNLAGGNPSRGRVKNDFYATSPSDTHAFLDQLYQDGFDLNHQTILEPCAGMGHIVDVLLERTHGTVVESYDINPLRDDILYNDYLNNKIGKKYDVVFTNPPFKLAKEFIDQSLLIADKVFIFAKIQFLEGINRKEWFKQLPLKYVYVYSFRATPLRNGQETDENGKKWANTMCFAWYVFDNEYNGEPIVRWI